MTTNARLHWFWRGMICTILGMALFTGLVLVANCRHKVIQPPERRLASVVNKVLRRTPGIAGDVIAISMIYTSVTVAVCLAAYARLSRDPAKESGEIHCRCCNHILRGLSEPRCPECGEAI